jgi:predicted ATPase
LRGGRIDRAVAALTQAGEDSRNHSNHFAEPDIFRLRGETLLAQSRANGAEAEGMFREAMTLAARQRCRILELRSAMSLARLLAAEKNRRDEARDLLAPVYAAFTEGFSRPDLLAAKALLAELG